MRAARLLLLVLILLVGQAHACPAIWVGQDGEVCATCATEPCPEPSAHALGGPSAAAFSAFGGDCHSCCELAPCPDEGRDDAPAVAAFPDLTLARIEVPLALAAPPPVVDGRLAVSVHALAHLPNAPPRRHASRAPPAPLP